MRKLLLIQSLIIVSTSFSQLATNQWRIHFSSFNTTGIAESKNEIFMACENGLVEYNLGDNSVSVLTATNGLSDLGISCIQGDGESIVVVGYGNGNVDIIEENSITNLPWIKTAQISGDKAVNAFHFDGDFIYCATNVGLVLIDNQRKEIKDTYYPFDNPIIYDVTIFNDTLYCATNDGIYYAGKNQSFLNDKTQWQHFSALPSNLQNQPIKEIETFGNKIVYLYDDIAYKSDSLYYIEDGVFFTYSDNPKEINDISVDNNELLISTLGGLEILNENLIVQNSIYSVNGEVPAVSGAIKKGDAYWFSDDRNGLVSGTSSWDTRSFYSNSPYADGSYRIDIQYGTVLVAGGGLTPNLQNTFQTNGVYKFQDESWTNFNATTQESMDSSQIFDFVSVVVNPNNTDELAFGSNSLGGLMVVRDGENITEIYNNTNSALELIGGKVPIADMKYDNDGNLWILNPGVEPLKMLTPEGIWYSFSLGSAAKEQYTYRLLIDANNNKWVAVNQVGLIAFNEGGTFDDGSDDQLRTLSTSEGYGNLPSVFVKSLAEDIDGEIWIGTELGMVVLYNTSNIYDGGFGEYDASSILIEVDGEVEQLLGESDITAITVDGGNRKWIGTSSSGVFCLSPDGTEEIYRYSKENSPLISNNIFDIRTDLLSGEVFFATESGLVSIRTDATLGDPDFENVKVFPNPVRPEYEGPITIQGLGYQSDVKVTDVSGNIVFKTQSNGGTVIWDGKTLQGERAQSGVYLVWSAIAGEKGKNVAKILLIN